MQLIRPQRFESNYLSLVQRNGARAVGYRTYQVPGTGAQRDTVIVTTDAPWIFSDAEERKLFDTFRQRLSESAEGRFLRAKGLVNSLHDGEVNLPKVGIFVHRHGLVPAFVLRDPAISQFSSDAKKEWQIALYPGFTGSRADPYRPSFMTSDFEFLRSLQISLQTQMKRYFEDVAEDMVDIQENLSFSEALRRAKSAEDTVATSIRAKLQKLLPSSIDQAKKLRLQRFDTDIQRLQHTVLLDNIGIVVWAQYARYYALFMLNELYALLGVGDRSDDYSARPTHLKKLVGALFDDPGWFDEHTASNPILSLLRTAWSAYYGDDVDTLASLRTDLEWVQKFVGFAIFLLRAKALAREENLSPESGRIFLSHQHGVPSSELLADQILRWTDSEGSGRVRTFRYRGSAGADIRAPIKTRIWSADEVISLVPRQAAGNAPGTKGLNWIVLEAEHAKLLTKRLVFVVQNQTDVSALESAIKSFDGDFLGQNTLLTAQERLDVVLTSIRDRVFQKFEIDADSETDSDSDLRRFVAQRVDQILAKRAIDRLTGFLQLIHEPQRKCAVRLHDIIPYPQEASKKRIAAELRSRWPNDYTREGKAEQIFESTWEMLRHATERSDREGRHLILKGRPFFLIKQVRNGKYSSMLSEAIKSSIGSASHAEIDDCVDMIKRRVQGGDYF